MAAPAIPLATLSVSLAPAIPLLGPLLGVTALGAVSWKLAAWWKASTATAAAPALAEAVVVEAVEAVAAATTVSAPMLVMGGLVVLAIISGGYYLYAYGLPSMAREASSDATPTPDKHKNKKKKKNKREHKDQDDDHLFRHKEGVSISKKRMRKLLEKHGQEIWEKLKDLGNDKDGIKRGKIWECDDYRVDVGSKLKDQPNVREWHLQANNGAKSNTMKPLGSRGTHEKLFWGKFDTNSPSDHRTFAEGILKSME